MGKEIKVGDKVRVPKDAPKIYFGKSLCASLNFEFVVDDVEDGSAAIHCGNGTYPIAAYVIPTKYLVKVEEEKPKIKVGIRCASKVTECLLLS